VGESGRSWQTRPNRAGWSVLRDAVRTQLWPIPAIGIALAAAAGILLPRLDARIDDNLPPTITDYLFGGPQHLRYSIALNVAIMGPITILLVWQGLKPYGRAVERAVREGY